MIRATIRTKHGSPEIIVASLTPDNTDDMTTAVVDEIVETQITRDSTGGLHTTMDDYLVNIHVATTMSEEAQTENMTTADNRKLEQ